MSGTGGRRRLAFVVQRYGAEVGGGSELHCRLLAERLAASHDVEVLTTTAKDYVSWAPYFDPGEEVVNGVRVRRFAVDRPRDLERFAAIQERVFDRPHTAEEGRRWFEENGPRASGLVDHLAAAGGDYDAVLFYTFRYYPSARGLPETPTRTILVPTAEDDPAIRLPEVRPLFERADGILYMTPEERQLVESATGVRGKPAAIIGCGVEAREEGREVVPASDPNAGRPYLLYLGRVDPNKGCDQLFAYFLRYLEDTGRSVDLLLAGAAAMSIPRHPRIRHLGFLSEAEKTAALAHAALLVMPSRYESLSIVVLEAWRLGKAVLVNGHCDVLRGQAERSNGGLWYDNYPELREVLEVLLDHPDLCRRLGQSGRRYVEAEYSWERIETKVLELLDRVCG